MATIRALWNSGGELVTRDSPFFPLRNAVFDLWPYRGKWPEIWIASHGPRMLHATGQYGDAWFPAAVFSPAEYARGPGRCSRRGVAHPLGDDFTGSQDVIPQILDEESLLSYTSNVPLSLLKDACLQGTPDEIVDQLAGMA